MKKINHCKIIGILFLLIVLYTISSSIYFFIPIFNHDCELGMSVLRQTIYRYIVLIPIIIGAIGIMKEKLWGKIIIFIISLFGLFSFPIGTILCIYVIWSLTRTKLKKAPEEDRAVPFYIYEEMKTRQKIIDEND